MESLELTVEDILNLHRGWITELYVEDQRTEAEIVNLLHERRLPVTLAQIRRCIEEWNLVQLPAEESSGPSPSPTLSDDWEFVSTPPKSEAFPRTVPPTSYTPSDPAEIFQYNNKPLPSIPDLKTCQKSSKIQKRRPPSTTDRLKLTCHHGPTPSDVHEVQTKLKFIPDGTSPIDRYTKEEQRNERIALGLNEDEKANERITLSLDEDEQTHERITLSLDENEQTNERITLSLDEDEQTQERIAVGSDKDEQSDELSTVDPDDDTKDIVLQPWRRAAEAVTTRAKQVRVHLPPKRLKNNKNNGNDEPAFNESTGKRKREPQRNEDEQEERERKKTPPSPPDEA